MKFSVREGSTEGGAALEGALELIVQADGHFGLSLLCAPCPPVQGWTPGKEGEPGMPQISHLVSLAAPSGVLSSPRVTHGTDLISFAACVLSVVVFSFVCPSQ